MWKYFFLHPSLGAIANNGEAAEFTGWGTSNIFRRSGSRANCWQSEVAARSVQVVDGVRVRAAEFVLATDALAPACALRSILEAHPTGRLAFGHLTLHSAPGSSGKTHGPSSSKPSVSGGLRRKHATGAIVVTGFSSDSGSTTHRPRGLCTLHFLLLQRHLTDGPFSNSASQGFYLFRTWTIHKSRNPFLVLAVEIKSLFGTWLCTLFLAESAIRVHNRISFWSLWKGIKSKSIKWSCYPAFLLSKAHL